MFLTAVLSWWLSQVRTCRWHPHQDQLSAIPADTSCHQRTPVHIQRLMYYIKHESPCLTTFPNLEKRVENTTRSGVFLGEIRGVWIADETLSRVFDVSPQSKKNYRGNGEVKSSKSILIKTAYANLLDDCDFPFINLMNYSWGWERNKQWKPYLQRPRRQRRGHATSIKIRNSCSPTNLTIL